MNKKIIISLSVIAIVAAIVVGGTIAYFSDTEVSQGNIFTAGNIDLKIDHTWQSYNGVDCQTQSVEIMSDTTNMVVSTNGGSASEGMPYPAVEVSNPHPNWTVTGDIPGATWIWATNPTTPEDAGNVDVYYTFQNKFEWYGPIVGATLNLGLGADNGYQVKLNGNVIGTDWTEFNYQSPAATYNAFGNYIEQGENILEIEVMNHAQPGGTPASNPAGLLYKLTIEGDFEDDDHFKANCRLWGWKDLVPGDKFFNFNDIKPGDWGTNVISYHVFNNDAHVCMIIDNTTDVEPSLSGALNFLIWEDAGYGVYDPAKFLHEGTLGADWRAYLGDIVGSTDNYIGVFWCAGNIVKDNGTLSCDGSVMGNEYQGAVMSADLIFHAEQSRHNPTFNCNTVVWPMP